MIGKIERTFNKNKGNEMKFTQTITTILCLITASISFAATQTLSTISVSGESYIMKLELNLDKKKDITSFKLLELVKGKTINDKTYQTSGAKSGIVLMEQSGRKVVKLQSDNFSSHNGGDVVLDYLYNGINGKRRKLHMDLSRDGDVWALYINGKKTTKMHFVKNKKAIVGVVGVKRIEVK